MQKLSELIEKKFGVVQNGTKEERQTVSAECEEGSVKIYKCGNVVRIDVKERK